MPKLIIVRGTPGTGKTTFAKHYVDEYSYAHFEADMYFERSGEYVFDAAQLGAAHAWCQAEVESALQRGQSVVVSNTFIRRREMNPYLAMAARHNAEVNIHVCRGEYGSVHNVPAEKMREMRARWEE